MVFFFSESLLNKKEDLRAEPSSGWMPIMDEEKKLSPRARL
jgi:hypothetical protein